MTSLSTTTPTTTRPPAASKLGRTLVDVSSLIEDATSALSVRDPMVYVDFQLQDSMAAIEIMDPVMDCCEVPVEAAAAGEASKRTTRRRVSPRNPPSSLACEDYLPDEVLLWEEGDLDLWDVALVGLEDVVRFESLLDGSSVAESTFTCLYLFVLMEMKRRRSNLAQRTLYTISLAFVKLTESVRTVVQHADIYEDEDFCMATHGLSFFNEVDGGETRRTMEDTLRELQEEDGGMGGGDGEASSPRQLLFHLVSFQSLFLEACATLATLSAASVSRAATTTTTTKTETTAAAAAPAAPASGSTTTTTTTTSPPPPPAQGVDTVEQTQQKIRKALQHLALLRDSPLTRNYDKDQPVIVRAFDDTINRRQMGNAPVRRVHFPQPPEALTAISRVLSELDTVVCQLLRVGPSLARIRRFLSLRSAPVGGAPHHAHDWHILTRSLVVLNLYFEDLLLGQFHLSRLIAKDMQRTVGVPVSFWTQKQTSSFDFLSRLGKPTYDVLKLACFNPNRQRAYMDVVMINDWCRQLPREAALMDSLLLQQQQQANSATAAAAGSSSSSSSSSSTPKVANYVLQIGTTLLDTYLRLGVQLQLVHQPHDLAVVYWYRDYLLSVLISISTASLRQATMLRQVRKSSSGRSIFSSSSSSSSSRHHDAKGRGGGATAAAGKDADTTASALGGGDAEDAPHSRSKSSSSSASASASASSSTTSTSRGTKKKKKRGGKGGGGGGGNSTSSSTTSLETTSTTATPKDDVSLSLSLSTTNTAAASTLVETDTTTTTTTTTTNAEETVAVTEDAEDEEWDAAAEEEDMEMNQVEYMVLNLHRCLCRGIVRALALLTKLGLVPPPPLLGGNADAADKDGASTSVSFSSARCLFEKRFEFLSQVPQPPPLCYDDFSKGSDTSAMSSADLTALATDSFQAAKALVDKLLKVSPQQKVLSKHVVLKMAKVAMGNLLFLHRLQDVEEEEQEAAAAAHDNSNNNDNDHDDNNDMKKKTKKKKKKKMVDPKKQKVSLDFSVHSHFCLFTMNS